MIKEPSPDNVVIGTVQLEEEWFTDLESAELLLPTGLPKIDLVKPLQVRQEVKPVSIRDSDEKAQVLFAAKSKRQAKFSLPGLSDVKPFDFHGAAIRHGEAGTSRFCGD